jgi:ABC-type polysaccharide/polyol phosphate transport system ATPase subunit
MDAISTQQITKVYKLYDRPLDRLKELLFHRPSHKELVALDGITFSLEKGATLGIIGDNGAGKSTLLKIIAKTLYPTNGQVEVKGIVTSLLELGSGFHPEMNGIDNIFFYGSLLGIEIRHMKKKLNDIIEFSELGDFINYPIKTYSTGMYVRLAFSVATAVDPDILIIDEALAVGDQHFQKKCLDKMNHFRESNKTVIFCSHDVYQVKSFCENTIWLDHGKIRMMGKTADIANAYVGFEQMQATANKNESDLLLSQNHFRSSFLFIQNLSAKQKGTNNLTIEFVVKSLEPFKGHVGWAILRKDRLKISFTTTQMKYEPPILFASLKKIRIEIKNLNLVNEKYIIYVGVFDKQAFKPIVTDEIEFTVTTGHEILSYLCHFDSTFIVT